MLSSKEITKKWEATAQGKASLSTAKCLSLGVLAGMYIGFGALGFTLLQGWIGGGLGKLLGACVFPAGLMLVVMAGAELFTGNCLMAGPAANGKVKWTGVVHNWLFVYLGNMAGALLLALLVYGGGIYAPAELSSAASAIAVNKCAQPFLQALLRGVMCNVLVCGAVWMASGADSAASKAVCCFFPIMAFVLCGFEHSVANMYYIPVAMLQTQSVSVGDYLVKNLLPVTLGNILGGAGLAIVYAKVYKD